MTLIKFFYGQLTQHSIHEILFFPSKSITNYISDNNDDKVEIPNYFDHIDTSMADHVKIIDDVHDLFERAR